MTLDTSEVITTEVSFKVTTKGGKEQIVGPITLDVISHIAYFKPSLKQPFVNHVNIT